jgi:PPOX class probable F420-dependent enzyme
VFTIDESDDFGARAAAHLRDDQVVWLTSVSPAGAPLPTPVWFTWDGATRVTVHSLATAKRNDHVRANPRVTLNFPGTADGGDIVVFSGRATVADDTPLGDDYLTKYAQAIPQIGDTPESFAQKYSTGFTIELTALRGH